MAVKGLIAVAVLDFHHIAIAVLVAGQNHGAVGSRVYRLANLAAKIQTVMAFGTLAAKRIGTYAEAGRDTAFVRHAQGYFAQGREQVFGLFAVVLHIRHRRGQFDFRATGSIVGGAGRRLAADGLYIHAAGIKVLL